MKKYILLFLLTILLIPNLAAADRVKTVEIKGVIGDFARQGRIYEVSGKLYRFDEDILIQDQDGTPLTFADLHGGMSIRIIGEKTTAPKAKTEMKYIKIIVMNKKTKLR